MHDSLERNFGLVVAYVVPGFVCLAGASRYSEPVATWMSVDPTSSPTVGGFLYVVVASLAAGLVVNAFRWVMLDSLLHLTGLVPPRLNFAHLQRHLEAFQLAVDHNYRYYQFYGCMVLASAFYSLADQWSHGMWSPCTLCGWTVVELILLATSRDCLRRYYERTGQMLGQVGGVPD
ncbi:MAG: hypothetical protein KF708_07820 [Pirellulales bacterium]|nr:hypothetical protein [Pirellulales bacterium]